MCDPAVGLCDCRVPLRDMRPTRTPASEWRELTESERRQRIRDGAVIDHSTLDPDLQALVDSMFVGSEAKSA